MIDKQQKWITVLTASVAVAALAGTASAGWESVATGELVDTYDNGEYTGFTMTTPGTFTDWIPDHPEYDPTVAPGDLENLTLTLDGTKTDSDGEGTVFYEGTYEILYAGSILVSGGTFDMTATWTGETAIVLEGTLHQTDGPAHENFTDLSFGGLPVTFTGTYEETGGGGEPGDPTVGQLNGSLVQSGHLVGLHFNSGLPGHPTITSGLNEAASGQTVVVTPGTYTEAINFDGKAVHLRSTDGPAQTIIDASGLATSVVTTASGEDEETILEGFTITGGEGTLVGDDLLGGGMYNNGTSPSIIDCVIEGNSADLGGGMYNTDGSSPTVTGIAVQGNTANDGGGIFTEANGSVDLSDTLICDNDPDAIVGPWNDLGGNTVLDVCPTTQPETPPDPVVISEECDEVTIGWPDGAEPPTGVTWYWQGTTCGESTELGSGPVFVASESGTYHLRAKNANSELWSEDCGSVVVTIEPCTVNVPTDAATIQEAIGLVADGGEVIVAAGTYNEAIDFEGKAVHLRSSDGPELTILDGTGLEMSVLTAVSGEGSDTIIEGFTITGGEGTLVGDDLLGGGMYNVSSSPTIIDCIFEGNTADFGGGMYNNASSPSVSGTLFVLNVAGSSGGGMYNDNASMPIVMDSAFEGNSADSGGGIFTEANGSVDLSDTLICENEPDGIVGPWNDLGGNMVLDVCPTTQPETPPNPVVISEQCDQVIIGWPGGAQPPSGVTWYWQGTTCGENTELGSGSVFVASESGTYHLRAKNANSELWSEDCGSVAVTVEPCTVNVPTDAATIQEAFGIVADGGEVIVAPGTYNEAIDFDSKAVHLRSSDGPELTILDGTGLGTSVVIANSGEGSDTIIEGFTITGGEGTPWPTNPNVIVGGAMYIAGSSPTVIDCVFVGNSAAMRGGAIYIEASGSPTFEDCVFEDNSAVSSGGAVYNLSSNPTLTSCTFVGNSTTDGGAIFNFNSSPILEDCFFLENTASNQGGAVYGRNNSNMIATNCTFELNEAHEGGGVYSLTSSPSVLQGLFISNSATMSGGGLFNVNSGPLVRDTVLEGNLSGSRGAGMFNTNSSPTVEDSDFIANSAGSLGGGISNADGSKPTVNNCSFVDNTASNGSGISNRNGSHAVIFDSHFENNAASSGGGGIYNFNSRPDVTNCHFVGNTANTGGGMKCEQNSNAKVTDCVFDGNTAEANGGGLFTTLTSIVDVTNCIFENNSSINNNGGGIGNSASSPSNVMDTVFCQNDPLDIGGPWSNLGGNQFVDLCPSTQPDTPPAPIVVSEECDETTIGWPDGARPLSGEIWYWQAFDCEESTDLGSDPTLIVTEGGTYRLRAKNANSDLWSEDCGSIEVEVKPCPAPEIVNVPEDTETIQDALVLVAVGGEVIVAVGTYNEAIDFDGKSVHLRSADGAEQTIIDATGLETSVITAISGEGPDTIIEGFTITGGEGTLVGGEGALGEEIRLGGGMYNVGSNPTIIDVIFEANTADFGGGMYNDASSPTVTGCLFVVNTATQGGGMYNGNVSLPGVTDSAFEASVADLGGGIFGEADSPADIAGTFFCENELDHIEGPWNDLGDNEFSNDCDPISCPGDLNDSGEVNVDDLLMVLNNWGSCPDNEPGCPGDANEDGQINVDDLLIVLNNWGPCP